MAGTKARPTVIMNGFGGAAVPGRQRAMVGRAHSTRHSRMACLTRHV